MIEAPVLLDQNTTCLIRVVVSSASASNASGLPLVTALGLADGVGELGALGSASLVLHETAISARPTIVASHGSALMQGSSRVPRVYPDPADRPAAPRAPPAVAAGPLQVNIGRRARPAVMSRSRSSASRNSRARPSSIPQVVGLDRDRRVAGHLRQRGRRRGQHRDTGGEPLEHREPDPSYRDGYARVVAPANRPRFCSSVT